MTLKELREARAKLVADMRGIIDAAETEDRDLTAEEQTAFDEKQGQLEAIDKRIERFANVEAAEAAGGAVIPAAARGGSVTVPQGPEARREFESLGEFMHAVRFRPNDQRLVYVENVGGNAEDDSEFSAEQRMDNDVAGGFMVPPQLRDTIMRVSEQGALVRPRAQVIPAGSPPDSSVTFPALNQSGSAPDNMYGGVQVNWTGEGEEMSESDADLGQITLTPHEVSGFATITDKLLRNWQAAGPFLEQLLRGAVVGAEDRSFLSGSGVHKPLGILNAGATKFLNRTTANTVVYADVLAMVSRMLMRDGSAPVWSMPQQALPKISTLKDDEGKFIWKADARDGFAGTLLGYPVRWNNRAPALGSKGDLLLADWSHYLIKDGSGPFVAASEHVKFTSNKTVIKIVWNVDGAPWLTAPIQEENGWEVTPFVGLDVPA